MSKRKICVVTGTRAEYGLLYWLMKEIRADKDLTLQVIATGTHFSPEFGSTYRVIEEDGFSIDARVEMLLSSDTPTGVAKSMGVGMIGFADAFERLNPDLLVLLGDRFEMLAAASSAMAERIPIAHLHGGESTEGAIDEAIRHAITKMSQLHFVAAEPYRQRVIQLGEDPSRVFNFGATAIDNIKNLKLMTKKQLESSLGFNLGKRSFLVTYHPVTLGSRGPEHAMRELFKALDSFPEAQIILTRPNADAGGREIIRMIDNYASKHPGRVMVSASLGQLKYLSAMKYVDAVIGNSSSGIIEAPALKKPAVNIGDRQRGRLKAPSVIDTEEKAEAISVAIKKALSSDFQRSLAKVLSPYGDGNSSVRIKNHLKKAELKNILLKRFFDIAERP